MFCHSSGGRSNRGAQRIGRNLKFCKNVARFHTIDRFSASLQHTSAEGGVCRVTRLLSARNLTSAYDSQTQTLQTIHLIGETKASEMALRISLLRYLPKGNLQKRHTHDGFAALNIYKDASKAPREQVRRPYLSMRNVELTCECRKIRNIRNGCGG